MATFQNPLSMRLVGTGVRRLGVRRPPGMCAGASRATPSNHRVCARRAPSGVREGGEMSQLFFVKTAEQKGEHKDSGSVWRAAARNPCIHKRQA